MGLISPIVINPSTGFVRRTFSLSFAEAQDCPDIARRREQWRKYQGRIDVKRLVFIDETWAKAGSPFS